MYFRVADFQNMTCSFYEWCSWWWSDNKCILQATEPYNNEESASRDEVGTLAADHVDGDNVDNVSGDEETWTRAVSADQDIDQQIKDGNKVNETQMRVMTSEKIMEELDQHSVPTTLVEEGDEMNIKNKKTADSVSKAETSKDSIVEVESLRAQVLILPKYDLETPPHWNH